LKVWSVHSIFEFSAILLPVNHKTLTIWKRLGGARRSKASKKLEIFVELTSRARRLKKSSSFANREAAARKLMEIANFIEPAQDGRIHIELINWPFLQEHRGSPAEYKAGLDFAIERGWLWLHESGTYMKFTPAISSPNA
jgi:hypothetical protein